VANKPFPGPRPFGLFRRHKSGWGVFIREIWRGGGGPWPGPSLFREPLGTGARGTRAAVLQEPVHGFNRRLRAGGQVFAEQRPFCEISLQALLGSKACSDAGETELSDHKRSNTRLSGGFARCLLSPLTGEGLEPPCEWRASQQSPALGCWAACGRRLSACVFLGGPAARRLVFLRHLAAGGSPGCSRCRLCRAMPVRAAELSSLVPRPKSERVTPCARSSRAGFRRCPPAGTQGCSARPGRCCPGGGCSVG